MTKTVALFHSVLGVRAGIHLAADHLFTDPSLPAEFDARSAEVLWDHVTRSWSPKAVSSR